MTATEPQAPVGALPAEGFIRLPQIIGDAKAKPPILPVLPVSEAQLWRLVKTGKFPPPIKFGRRLSMWPVGVVRAWLACPTL
ncbi:MAG: AlpA family phage regulatory protein [Piscinibacter sp.]